MVCNDRVEWTDVHREQAPVLSPECPQSNFHRRLPHRSSKTYKEFISNWALVLVLLILLSLVEGFATRIQADSARFTSPRWRRSHDGLHLASGNLLKMTIDDSEDDDVGSFQDFGPSDLEGSGVMLEDLNWRVEKLRLEEANTRRFLKSKPRFLPYDECAKWVQAFGRWETEEDWNDWIAMGEKRNSYIPSQPDQYYGRLGQWISWDHFLGITRDDDKKE